MYGSDASALGYCKEHYTVLTLSQIAELLEQGSSEEEPESEEVENKKQSEKVEEQKNQQ